MPKQFNSRKNSPEPREFINDSRRSRSAESDT